MSFGVTASSAVSGAGASAYATAVLAYNPLMYLRLDEASGIVAVDSSGNNHNGTHINSPIVGQAGVIDGPGKSVHYQNDVANPKVTTSVTYGSWMDTAEMTVLMAGTFQFSSISILVGRYNEPGSDWSWFVYINGDGTFRFYYQSTGGQSVQMDSGVIVQNGKRYYIAAYVGSTGAGIRVYDETGIIGTSVNTGYAVKSSSRAIVVADAESGSYATAGYIDEISYHGTALSAAQIDTLASIAV